MSSPRTNHRLSSFVFVIAPVALAAYLCLVLYLPHLESFWSATGSPLTAGQKAMIDFGHRAQDKSVAVIVASSFAAALAWRISAAMRSAGPNLK